jgi:hypothetical protein
MKKYLIILGLTLGSLASYAQSGQDFPTFGDEVLSTANKIQIYPNPSTDFVNVTIHNSELEKTVMIVYSILGTRFEMTVELVEQDQYRIDVRELPAGYYLLSVKDPTTNFSETYKFLKR